MLYPSVLNIHLYNLSFHKNKLSIIWAKCFNSTQEWFLGLLAECHYIHFYFKHNVKSLILIYFVCYGRLPRWNSGKKSTCQWRKSKRFGFETWVGKTPWSRKWQPTPVFLPGKFHGQRSLAATVERVTEHQMWLTDWAEIFWIIFVYQTCLLQIFSPGFWFIFSFSS